MKTEKTVKKRNSGRFQPGQSGNPKGRTPIAAGGKPNDIMNIRSYIGNRIYEVIDEMILQALAGDTTAANNLVKHVLPNMQAAQLQIDQSSLPIMKIITQIAAGPDNQENDNNGPGNQDNE